MRPRLVTTDAALSVSVTVSISALNTSESNISVQMANQYWPVPTRATSPDMTFSELRKGTASRKFGYSSATRSHRRGSALSKINGFSPLDEEEETSSPSTSGSSSQSSVFYKSSAASTASYGSSKSSSRGSSNKIDLEYSAKRHRSSSGKSSKKGHSSRSH